MVFCQAVFLGNLLDRLGEKVPSDKHIPFPGRQLFHKVPDARSQLLGNQGAIQVLVAGHALGKLLQH